MLTVGLCKAKDQSKVLSKANRCRVRIERHKILLLKYNEILYFLI